MRVRARDNQRSKCYSWEWGFLSKNISNKPKSDEGVVALVEKACARYGIKPPAIVFTGNRKACYGGIARLHIADWGKTPLVILHESAHAITDVLFGRHEIAGHGKEWVGVYIELLSWYYNLPVSVFKKSASLYKIKTYSVTLIQKLRIHLQKVVEHRGYRIEGVSKKYVGACLTRIKNKQELTPTTRVLPIVY